MFFSPSAKFRVKRLTLLADDNLACPECEFYKNHKQKYTRASEMYILDSKTSSNSRVYTADLQKVRTYFIICQFY